MKNYLIVIDPYGQKYRCFKENIPDGWLLITYDHPLRNTFYTIDHKLKPEYWALERYIDKDALEYSILEINYGGRRCDRNNKNFNENLKKLEQHCKSQMNSRIECIRDEHTFVYDLIQRFKILNSKIL